MKLFKILNKLSSTNHFRLVDITGKVIFDGDISPKTSLPISLLNCKVSFFIPLVDDHSNVSVEVANFANDVTNFVQFDKMLNAQPDGSDTELQSRRNRALRACMASMMYLPTEITLSVLQSDLKDEIDIINTQIPRI